MPLSDLSVRKAKGREKPYKLSDERGLFIIVNPNGSKWWRLNFTLEGKRRTMSLGVYPDVELADAREGRETVRKQIAKGVDPVRARKGQSGDEKATFKAVTERWLATNKGRWCDHNYNVTKRRLERLIYPSVGERDIRTIHPSEMVKVFRKIEAGGATELPRRMNTTCGCIFRFANAEGLQAYDPTQVVRGVLKRKSRVKHHAMIMPDKMGEFLAAITTDIIEKRDTVDALMLTILSACRTSEVRFAEAKEFEGLHGDQPLWRIPGERMKLRKEHLVPMSRQTVELVQRRIRTMPRGQTFLFGRYTRSSVISENTMLFCLYRMGYRGKATVHGFRRTFSTKLNEQSAAMYRTPEAGTWHPDVIERALAHFPISQVRGAYNAAEYLSERRVLLQWWADFLDAERVRELPARRVMDLIG